jgi:hypothetical protein
MDVDTRILRDLARRLRAGTVRHLNGPELNATLGWVSGRDSDAGGLTPLLGPPEADPPLLERVYRQLDGVLFRDEWLNETAAWLHGDPEQRRAQYRRLFAAFHPDRSAQLESWLTPRFQAIQRSYRRFRDESSVLSRPPPVSPGVARESEADRGHRSRPFRFRPSLKQLLQSELGKVRHLEAKLLGLVLIGAVLGVLQVYLAHAPQRWIPAQEPEAPPERAQTGESAAPRAAVYAPGHVAILAAPVDAVADSGTAERVIEVVRHFQHAYEAGNIEMLMRSLSDRPRENRNHGRDWFRRTYAILFERSELRELNVAVEAAEPGKDGAWRVSGRFDLRVDYPGERQFTASGPIRYRLIEQNQEWHIASIDY